MIDYDSVQSCELGQFNRIVYETHEDIELMEILLSSNFNTLGRIFQITVRNIIGRGRSSKMLFCSCSIADLCHFHFEVIC